MSLVNLKEGVSWAMARSFLVADLFEDDTLTGVFVFILVSTVLAALPVEYNIIRFVRDPLGKSSSVAVISFFLLYPESCGFFGDLH